jgi:hypothetical protein
MTAVEPVQDWSEDFSSFQVTVTPVAPTYDHVGNRLRSIITTDEPDHTPERRLMLPFFSLGPSRSTGITTVTCAAS